MKEPDLLARLGHAAGDPSAPHVLFFLLLLLLVVGSLVGRFAKAARHHVRSAGVAIGLFVLATIVAAAVEGRTVEWAGRARALAQLFAHVTVIDLVAALVFFVILPRVRVEVPDIVRDLVIALAYLLAVGALFHRFGVDVTSLAASGAAVTVVVGFALQATLGNAVGGVALRLDGTIREGEWIRLPDKSEGLVRRIRWRHTDVETRNGDTLVVPNGQLVAQNILVLGRNEKGPRQHRMWVYFDVDFRYSPDRVVEVVEQALGAAPIENVSSSPPPNCICYDFTRDGFNASSARYAVRYFLTDLWRDDPTSSVVRARVHAALGRAGIAFSLPSQSVLMSKENKQRLEAGESEEIEKRCAVIQHIELFRALTDDERKSIARRLVRAPFARGEIITKQGAEAHWLYILAEGSADIRITVDGEESLVAESTAPTIFGEMSLMTGAPRRATVRATAPVLCYRLDKEAFREVITKRPEIATEISKFLAHRMVELEAAREHLDESAKGERLSVAHGRILASVKSFFGLDEV